MALGIRWLLDAPLQGLVGQADKNKLRFSSGWNRLPLAQQWLDKHGVEPIKRRFEAFQQENPAAANIKSEADKEALLRQFQAWDARAQMGSEVDSNKVRDGDQSATQAAPPRDPPRRSPPGATQGISTTDHPSSDFPERQYVFR